MVKTSQPLPEVAIRQLTYRSSRHARLPVEVVRRDELLERYGERFFRTPERLDFHVLMLATGGVGAHEVDFAPVALRPGSILLISPGQVHRFLWQNTLVADMVVYPPESASPIPPPRSPPLHLGDEDARQLARDVAVIAEEQERFDGSPRHAALLKAQLQVILCRTALHAGAPSVAGSRASIHEGFCDLLERSYATTRCAQDYADELGYSLRTLNRACVGAVGQSAKGLIQDRVALEAKRLLAGTDASTEAIAAALGFSESTNFVKFFRRLEGTTPRGFRDDHR